MTAEAQDSVSVTPSSEVQSSGTSVSRTSPCRPRHLAQGIGMGDPGGTPQSGRVIANSGGSAGVVRPDTAGNERSGSPHAEASERATTGLIPGPLMSTVWI